MPVGEETAGLRGGQVGDEQNVFRGAVMTGRDSPELAALKARPVPGWYDAAKFGVFIHWGMFAIPAFAARLGSISDAFKSDYDRAVAMTPYTEWYANAIKVAGTPSADFHKANYGDQPYEAFKAPFLSGLGDWEPQAWAQSFRDAGARYVVLVTKHHDGFCLWPSGVRNPNRVDWFSPRDLVGELANAVRAEGLRFGVYYSGGIDWSFNPEPLSTLADFMGSVPGGAYPAYAEAQVRELVARYEPDLLWNDISWPQGQAAITRLFSDYYKAVPQGVVNDRWTAATFASRLLRFRLMRRLVDGRIKRHLKAHPDAVEGVIPPVVPHSDFRTPEYTRFPTIQSKKWEATRGMSHSFGFNRNDRESDYASPQTLLADFIDGVSKGGNLLLNVGPMADGTIPQPQLERLQAFGAWLRVNGAAIYGASPWREADVRTEAGAPVRFTCRDGRLHIIVLGAPEGVELRLDDRLPLDEVGQTGHLLSNASPVTAALEGGQTVLRFTHPLSGEFAPVISLTREAAG